MLIKYAGHSHIGHIRENNEDNIYVNGAYKTDENRDVFFTSNERLARGTFAVFDGMGGEDVGELASLKAAQVLDEFSIDVLITDPLKYIHDANTSIYNDIIIKHGKRTGSTAAVLTIKDELATIVNIGDSRIYMLRNNNIEQLSVDHTRAQQMVEAGIISIEESEQHALKHVLTQHLGVPPNEYVIEPYIYKYIGIQNGDVFLLCSDGLTEMLSVGEIETILKRNENTKAIAEELVDKSLKAGGKDNISVIVVKIESK